MSACAAQRAVAARVVAAAAAVFALGAAMPAPPAAAAECNTTPDRRTGMPWAQQRLQPQRAWPLTRGDGVLVAVIDSGIDRTNPHLARSVVQGVDVLGPPGGPADADCSGHGTLVAGLIAGLPRPGSPFAGVAPGARLLAIRQNENSPGQGPRGDTNGMARAIVMAVDRGARVINVSATAPVDAPALREAVRYAATQDVLVVAAAGNDDPERGGEGGPAVYYPAAYREVLAVAATGRDDRRSATSHSAAYVDVAAPGVDIVSTGPNGPGVYAVVSGTSFAAPFVAGTAALVRSRYPDMSAREVAARIIATADPPGVRTGLGAGVVNPYAAVTAVLPSTRRLPSGVELPQPEDVGYGGGAARAPAEVPIALPSAAPTESTRQRRVAVAVSASALLLALLVLLAAAVVPAGRRRRWRAGQRGVRPVGSPPHD